MLLTTCFSISMITQSTHGLPQYRRLSRRRSITSSWIRWHHEGNNTHHRWWNSAAWLISKCTLISTPRIPHYSHTHSALSRRPSTRIDSEDESQQRIGMICTWCILDYNWGNHSAATQPQILYSWIPPITLKKLQKKNNVSFCWKFASVHWNSVNLQTYFL